MNPCICHARHDRRRIVLTGGPGAGKTAVLELILATVWGRHPRRFVVQSSPAFLDKAAHVLEILRRELPDCCTRHVIPAVDQRRHTTDDVAPDDDAHASDASE